MQVLVDVGVLVRQGLARHHQQLPALGLGLGLELGVPSPDETQDVGVGDEGELAVRVVHVSLQGVGGASPISYIITQGRVHYTRQEPDTQVRMPDWEMAPLMSPMLSACPQGVRRTSLRAVTMLTTWAVSMPTATISTHMLRFRWRLSTRAVMSVMSCVIDSIIPLSTVRYTRSYSSVAGRSLSQMYRNAAKPTRKVNTYASPRAARRAALRCPSQNRMEPRAPLLLLKMRRLYLGPMSGTSRMASSQRS